MYIFNSIKKQLKRLGIYRPHASNESNHFNSRNLIFISICGVATILLGVSLINLKTISEFSVISFLTSGYFTLMYSLYLLVSQTPTIYRFIDKFEMIIQKREFQASNTSEYT